MRIILKVLLLPEILGELEELGAPKETLSNFTRWVTCSTMATITTTDTTLTTSRWLGEEAPDQSDLNAAMQALAR